MPWIKRKIPRGTEDGTEDVWIAPASASQVLLLDRLPTEIVGLIADRLTGSGDQNNLCKVNKFCNAACTPALYGGPIGLNDEYALDSLSDTLLQHRPSLASLVKDVGVYDQGECESRWYVTICFTVRLIFLPTFEASGAGACLELI